MICVLCTLTEKRLFKKKQTVSKIKSNARIISLNIFLYTYNMTYPETEDWIYVMSQTKPFRYFP